MLPVHLAHSLKCFNQSDLHFNAPCIGADERSRASRRVNGRSAGVLVTHSCVEGTVSPALASEHTLFSGAVSCDRVETERAFSIWVNTPVRRTWSITLLWK